MKIVVLTLLFIVSILQASDLSDVGRIDLNSKHNYTIVNNKIIYLFENNSVGKLTSKKQIKELAIKAKKAICKESNTRDIIEKGYDIYYLYPGEKSMNIILIEDCDIIKKTGA